MSKLQNLTNTLNEIVKDDKDRWRVHVDDHTKSFVIYRGDEDICGGYFDHNTKRIKGVEFMDKKYQKSNMIRIKVINLIKKTFPDYK